MRKHLPLSYRGESLSRVKLAAAVRAPRTRSDPRQVSAYAGKWLAVQAHQGDGEWWIVPGSIGLGVTGMRRLYDAIRKRFRMLGHQADTITLIPTSRDGLCFRWRMSPNDQGQRIKMVTAQYIRRAHALLNKNKVDRKCRKQKKGAVEQCSKSNS